jgi:peptide deformylase
LIEETITGFKAKVIQHEADHFMFMLILNSGISRQQVELTRSIQHSKLYKTLEIHSQEVEHISKIVE